MGDNRIGRQVTNQSNIYITNTLVLLSYRLMKIGRLSNAFIGTSDKMEKRSMFFFF